MFLSICNSLQQIDLYTGGVSMGDKDFVKPILERRGTVHFGKVSSLLWDETIMLSFLVTMTSSYNTSPLLLALP